MAEPITVLKSIRSKLVPFFTTVFLYFVLYHHEKPSIFFCLFKCLPIISLMLFVRLQGMRSSINDRYSRRILIGLVFGCLGDALLVWKKNYFLHGTAMFAVSHFMYITAFGWKPFDPYTLGVLSVIGCIGYYYISSGLKGIMVYMVALYVILLLTMTWRAIARVQFFDGLWTWPKLCGGAGAILFLISDSFIAFIKIVSPIPFADTIIKNSFIAFSKFLSPIPFVDTIIMSTYYTAQFGISLSVVDSQARTFQPIQIRLLGLAFNIL